jgi:hypothetical protein
MANVRATIGIGNGGCNVERFTRHGSGFSGCSAGSSSRNDATARVGSDSRRSGSSRIHAPTIPFDASTRGGARGVHAQVLMSPSIRVLEPL